MGEQYLRLISDRNMLLGQVQAYAACEDEDVRASVRREFGELWQWVELVSGRSADDVRHFFADGMLINVQAAMDLPAVKEDWATRSLGRCPE